MNFLGHFFLATDSEPLIIGNFIADFVKGKHYKDYPEEIAEGILMHREIDSFTDQHEYFIKSRRRIQKNQHHYSGVVMDIFYDHFLAADFDAIANKDLTEFSEHIYGVIDKYKDVLPEQSKYLFRYMKRDNWLERYSDVEGIRRTLLGMSRRVKHKNNMAEALVDLEENYTEIQNDFCKFIVDARTTFNPNHK